MNVLQIDEALVDLGFPPIVQRFTLNAALFSVNMALSRKGEAGHKLGDSVELVDLGLQTAVRRIQTTEPGKKWRKAPGHLVELGVASTLTTFSAGIVCFY